jgi:hypothetical protein
MAGDHINLMYQARSHFYHNPDLIPYDHIVDQCCQLFLKVSGQIFEKIRPLGNKIRPHMKTCFRKNK